MFEKLKHWLFPPIVERRKIEPHQLPKFFISSDITRSKGRFQYEISWQCSRCARHNSIICDKFAFAFPTIFDESSLQCYNCGIEHYFEPKDDWNGFKWDHELFDFWLQNAGAAFSSQSEDLMLALLEADQLFSLLQKSIKLKSPQKDILLSALLCKCRDSPEPHAEIDNWLLTNQDQWNDPHNTYYLIVDVRRKLGLDPSKE